jgi:Ca2+-binding EF-hand superfamily protein
MPRQEDFMISISKKTGGGIVLALALCAAPALANEDHEAMFKKMDANGDGRVSAAEHDAYAASMFSKADANGDGKLTKGELTGFMVDEKGKSDKMSEHKSDKKMNMFDTNSDGTLTQSEFMTGMKNKFTEKDVNKDGAITADEMEDSE